jgi:sarcosine oxidase
LSEIAVVGAGVMGLATAHALAREGRDVVVYEQFARGHARGSSHGRTRIFRLAYPDPEWIRFAQEAYDAWRRLERETGVQLLELNGLLEIVDELEHSSAAALDAAGVEWQRLDPDEVARRYPLRVPDGHFAVLQPKAGIVHADRALAALERDLDVRYDTRIDSVDELDAEVVVVAAGAWVNDLVVPPLPVRVTRETVCFFRLADSELPLPALVSVKPGSHAHAFFALADPVHGVKVGAHHAGPETDPHEEGVVGAELVERVVAWARERFDLADPDPVETQTCLYTTTADEGFVLERRGRVVVGSACSGHGFKFAPAVGDRLARLAAS